MNKEIKLKKATYQLKKITMKSIMLNLLEEVQDGNLPKSIEIISPNNSKKRKLEEQQRLPLQQQKNQKAKKEKKVKEAVKLREKLKKKRKRKRKH